MKKQVFSKERMDEQIEPIQFKEEMVLLAPHPELSCEQVKAFRGDLIANVSHDLRTPLQSIIGYSETLLLKNGNISTEDQKKYLEVILASANNLSCMIEKFFEYSKLEISEIIPERKKISINKLVDELNLNYEFITHSQEIDFEINVEDELPDIFGDYLLIYRVFQNLIDNAIKFTPQKGKITINLTQQSISELKVQISDTGLGIPSDDLDAIFNKFQTTKRITALNKENDGLGLGLALVKKILSLHCSKIFVTSEVGKGTIFTFYLPVENPNKNLQ